MIAGLRRALHRAGDKVRPGVIRLDAGGREEPVIAGWWRGHSHVHVPLGLQMLLKARSHRRNRLRSPAQLKCQKVPYPSVGIFCRVGIVFKPMIEGLSAGLERWGIETVVSARVSDEFDRRIATSPARDQAGAVLSGCPVVKLADENERRYAWPGTRPEARGIEGNGCAKGQIAW